jgi:hypothetical protein
MSNFGRLRLASMWVAGFAMALSAAGIAGAANLAALPDSVLSQDIGLLFRVDPAETWVRLLGLIFATLVFAQAWAGQPFLGAQEQVVSNPISNRHVSIVGLVSTVLCVWVLYANTSEVLALRRFPTQSITAGDLVSWWIFRCSGVVPLPLSTLSGVLFLRGWQESTLRASVRIETVS